MLTNEIRSAYLDFFAERGHRVVPSSSLVPVNDPTLLFTNAGMVQFKDALTGRERSDYRRAVSCQRCVRAGGKHNDLENVGYTGRHQTLFEMLGNFSFGDYFKEDAIAWAWQFVTEVLKLSKDRLWVTVHPDDSEAQRIWVDKIGLDANRVVLHPDNFWAMGDTGPCGPDSELFYDLGPNVRGGPPGSTDEDGDRFSEFWNLVFPQYDRSADGTLTPLDSPGVDTGMGLERIAAIVQGGSSNYDGDLLKQLIAGVVETIGLRDLGTVDNPSLRVLADHARAATFLIADGVLPSNEDRGYVLRRIIRRGLRHGQKLGIDEPFFHHLVDLVVGAMGSAYPQLAADAPRIAATLAEEEDRFADTLRSGMALLNKAIADRRDIDTIPGDLVFKLYDTYGFPADLTADVARERGMRIDQQGFDQAMAEQRQRGRAAARFAANVEQSVRIDAAVSFTGYASEENEAEVIALFQDRTEVEVLAEGQAGIVVLNATPFYAEAGGQIGDRGTFCNDTAVFQVEDTTKGGDQHLHHGRVSRGPLRKGDRITAAIDAKRRHAIALNHSATHLLHAALREVLGSHVQQKGSLVAADRLRFDFSHPRPVGKDELATIEALVNTRIRENTEVRKQEMSFADAIEAGALALFGEKYADRVRVLDMGNGFSVELCGGTHVDRTGDIGLLRIVSEEGVAAGIRRIEAVTGSGALAWSNAGEQQLETLAALLKGSRTEVADKVRALLEQTRSQQKEIEALQGKLAATRGADLANRAVNVNGIQVLAETVEGDPKSLPATMDNLRDRLGNAVVVLAHRGKKVSLVTGVSKPVADRINASEVIRFVGAQVGAKGGGKADMARAGGGDKPERLADALNSVADWVRSRTAA